MNSFAKHFLDSHESPGAGMEPVPLTSTPQVPLCGGCLFPFNSHNSLTLDPTFQMEEEGGRWGEFTSKGTQLATEELGLKPATQTPWPQTNHAPMGVQPLGGSGFGSSAHIHFEPSTYATHPKQAPFQMLIGEVNKLEENIHLNIIICNDS